MRAAVQWTSGGPFEIGDVDVAAPGPGEVGVRLRAAGVCASDLALTTVFGQPTPVVLGHEGAGTVDEIGPGVSDLQVGDTVLVLWIPACGQCAPCLRGDEYLCARRASSADRRAGRAQTAAHRLSIGGNPVHQGMNTATFAERTVLPRRAVLPIPSDVPFPVAAMLGCAVPTAAPLAPPSACSSTMSSATPSSSAGPRIPGRSARRSLSTTFPGRRRTGARPRRGAGSCQRPQPERWRRGR